MSRFVRVKYVNSPKKEGGKFGNIKDESGDLVWVPVDQLRLFNAGQEYEIETKRQKWGQDWVEILDKVIYGSGGGRQQSAPQTQSRPAPQTGGHRPGGIDQSLHIFVTGIVGRAMGSGKFGPDDVIPWTKAAIDAFFRGQVYIAKLQEDLANDGAPEPEPEPQQRSRGPQQDFSRDPNDEIPF